MSGILYFDLETSGLDPVRHCILQAAWIIERDGEILVEREMDVRPFVGADLCLPALDVNGFTLERIKAGAFPERFLYTLLNDLESQVWGSEIVRPCGHNVQFDVSFLLAAAKRHNISFIGQLDFTKMLDTVSILRFFDLCGKISLMNYKLETVCRYFNIPIQAHDALEDVRAVRTVLQKSMELYRL